MSATVGQRVSAVIDMREYARKARPGQDWFAGRTAPAFADDAVSISAVALRGTGQVEALGADECVLVLAGSLQIVSAGGALRLETEDCGVIPFGTSFTWTASDDLLALVYSAATDQPGNSTVPLAIDKTAPLNPSNPPALENLLGEVPTCRGFSDYVSANREFCAGTWDSTPYHRRRIPYRQVEFMLLLEGSVTFADDEGSVTFTKGDVCMFVRGDGCSWLSEVYVKKVFATQRPVA